MNFPIEISTFSQLSYWNLYFLLTFVLKSLLSLNATSELSCQCVSQSAVAFPNNMPRIACLSATPQPLKPPANASSTLQLHSPIICRALLSCPRPLNPPANASRNLQLHSPIIRCASLSLTQPLNSPANASSALQLHSPIIYRALLSLTQPLNSPANASSALQLHFPIELRTPKNQWKAMPQSRRVPPPQPRRNRAAHAPQPPRTKRSDPSYRQLTSLRVRTRFATFRNSEVSLLNFLWQYKYIYIYDRFLICFACYC